MIHVILQAAKHSVGIGVLTSVPYRVFDGYSHLVPSSARFVSNTCDNHGEAPVPLDTLRSSMAVRFTIWGNAFGQPRISRVPQS